MTRFHALLMEYGRAREVHAAAAAVIAYAWASGEAPANEDFVRLMAASRQLDARRRAISSELSLRVARETEGAAVA